MNSTTPFVVAATLGIPLVDADGMGRAFPELQMVTATLKGIRCAPMVVADEKGNDVLVDTEDNLWAERLARAATVEMGCSTMTAQYMMTGREVKECLVPNSITLAHDLGRTLQESRARHADPVDAIAERLEGVRLFTGKVIDVERRTERGFARGFTQLRGIDNDEGSSITIRFQNEYLIVTRTTDDGDGSDAEVLASVPDLIICLDLETGDPITTEELRYGFRVAVIGAPCYDAWRSAEGLSLVGPRYFGYEIEYVPVRRGRITQVECATKERK